MSTPLTFQTLSGIADQLASGALTSVQLTQAVIDQTAAVESRVNALLSHDAADALAIAVCHAHHRPSRDLQTQMDVVQ